MRLMKWFRLLALASTGLLLSGGCSFDSFGGLWPWVAGAGAAAVLGLGLGT